jgi:aspartate aminotransferase-like enzyme
MERTSRLQKQMVPLTVFELARLQQSWARILSTTQVPLVVPGEAILGIEAIAAGVAAPGLRVLNLVSGPYGDQFGTWLERRGAEVVNLKCGYHEVIDAGQVARAIESHRPTVLALVQAESATGGTNPTAAILSLARDHGLVTIVDAVSAVGAEPVLVDPWGADFVAVGAQKGLAGPNGVSAVVVSPRGWALVEANPSAPRGSILSLLDHRAAQAPGLAVPTAIPVLEARALVDALALVEEEGLDAVYARHRRASAATRAALGPLGLVPWQAQAENCAPVNTTVRVPSVGRALEVPVGLVAPGDGVLRGQLWRVNHYGANADLGRVEEAVETLASLVGRPAGEALAAAQQAWHR